MIHTCNKDCSDIFGHGPNFMTPHVLGRGKFKLKGRVLYWELATDRGDWARVVERDPSRGPIVGVTVRDGNGQDVGLSRCFRSEDEARKYIDTLRKLNP